MKKITFFIALLAVTAQCISVGNAPVEAHVPVEQPSVKRLSNVAYETPDPWGQMEPVVDSLVLAMVDRGLDYDLENPEFLWSSLYYLLSINPVSDFRVTELEESYLIPVEMMEDCAYALFGDATLPIVPEAMADFVTKEGDDYILLKGDKALVEVVLEELQDLGNGSYVFQGALVSLPEDMAVISHFETTVTMSNGMFGYSVVDTTVENVFVNAVG